MKQLSFSNQTVELLLPLKCKNSRIATTDLEYGALFNDYGEYADNLTVNINIFFRQNLTKEVNYFRIQSIPGLLFTGRSISEKSAWSQG